MESGVVPLLLKTIRPNTVLKLVPWYSWKLHCTGRSGKIRFLLVASTANQYQEKDARPDLPGE